MATQKRAMELRDYQIDIRDRAYNIIVEHGIVVLSMQVRTGKTLTAFSLCDILQDCEKVLMITKKKPIESGTLKKDYEDLGCSWKLDIINFESAHKIEDDDYDCIIVDEFHSIAAFPIPSLRTKKVKEIFDRCKPAYHIMLSGTPSPESWSQLYHPFWVNQRFTPFEEKSFYKWANAGYVDVKKKYIAHGNQVNDYSKAEINMITEKISKYYITYTQKEAGFTSEAKDIIHKIQMKYQTYKLITRLEKDLILENKSGDIILGDTPVKLMSKSHQMYSGTVITEEGDFKILDTSKTDYIKENFQGKKLAIFYKYKGELEMITKELPNVTTDINEFNNSDKHIALQISSGREGISLKAADILIMFNIDYSNLSYIQGRDRLTSKDRDINEVHWLFSKGGIELEIYKTITIKKSKFNSLYYKKWKASSQQWSDQLF